MNAILLYLTLVAQLGNPAYRVRQEAERKLDAAGGIALPAVFVGTYAKDAEVRHRCEGLLHGNRWHYLRCRAIAVTWFFDPRDSADDYSRRWAAYNDALERDPMIGEAVRQLAKDHGSLPIGNTPPVGEVNGTFVCQCRGHWQYWPKLFWPRVVVMHREVWDAWVSDTFPDYYGVD